MDPQPPAPPSTAPLQASAAPTITNAVNNQLIFPESVENSPRSRIVDNWVDEPLPPVPGAKLRLMCSYGGHIMPRPHDKTLCYVGGDTRIVVVDRHSSLKELCGRLSRTLLNGRPFTLKYQLPHEDLDNLITVSTDEDLENMIEEHERLTAAAPPRPTRLRLFLFFSKPESTVSMGSLIDDAKSETWFVDALNNSGILIRGASDSATVGGGVLNLDKVPANDSSNNLEAQAAEFPVDNNKQVKILPDVHSLPDSPLVDNSSSCGSSSSSPSMANLPPIRVRVVETGNSRLQEEQRPGIEEQLAQMTFGANGIKQDEGYVMTMLSAPMPTIPAPMTMASPALVTGENMNRVISDDERSDQAVPAGLRKPPLPLQLVQPRTSGGLNLPSPDSVASDSSVASATSFSRAVYYQDQVQAAYADQKAPTLSHPNKSEISDHIPGYQRERVQDSNYTLPSQLDQSQQIQQQQQQQFVHANTHYIPHPAATGQVPMSPYYPVYTTPSQQQIPHPINQQYPVYVMPVGHAQPYNMAVQPNMADPSVITTSSRPLIPQSVAGTPPVYPPKPATASIPEVAQTVYKAPVPPTPAFVQMPSGQYQQQQFVGVPQIHHQPQSIAVASSSAAAHPPVSTTNYGYDYSGPAQEQAYYMQQQQAIPLPSQYQSMTPAAAAALSDASTQ
ncbi:uncharacterized protein LOC129310918 [Prosopis cineraria]|uniref:uncharacterized protein LOC129310918 n=1 Tax=Prosopis cineraria TaxID=364024 RepID=UPI0024102498|nr:uncharacterized protein LOC129310918 [Prosopis cineraria]